MQREVLDRESLRGKVPRQNKSDARRFGFELAVEAGFAREEYITTVRCGIGEKLAARSTRDCNPADRAITRADDLNEWASKRGFDMGSKLFEGHRGL